MAQKRKNLKINKTNLWYLVGLIASDGSLSNDGRHIDITFADYGFLCKIKKRIKLKNKVGIKYSGKGWRSYRIQIANKNLYDFLLSIGLTPKKSLNLKHLRVPRKYFLEFLRGLIDDDGGIQRWMHNTNKREQWNLRITSGSEKFLKWVKDEIEKLVKVKGRVYSEGVTQFILKYGKMAASIIAQKCYYKGCLGLTRKIELARNCVKSHKGWCRSRTVGF